MVSQWPGHYFAAGALLLVAVTVSYFGRLVRLSQQDRVLNPMVAWVIIAALTGYGLGSIVSAGSSTGWRFWSGFFAGAALAGGLRWVTFRHWEKSSPVEEQQES